MLLKDDADRQAREEELAKGHRAERAYQEFVAPFIKEKKQIFYEAFNSTEPDDTNRLSQIRRMVMTLDTLDQEMKAYMTTGQMARIQLEESENDE